MPSGRTRASEQAMTGRSTAAILGLFLIASVPTWAAGLVLADTTDALRDRFGLGDALGA